MAQRLSACWLVTSGWRCASVYRPQHSRQLWCKLGLRGRLQLQCCRWKFVASMRSHWMGPQTVQIHSSWLQGHPVRGVLRSESCFCRSRKTRKMLWIMLPRFPVGAGRRENGPKGRENEEKRNSSKENATKQNRQNGQNRQKRQKWTVQTEQTEQMEQTEWTGCSRHNKWNRWNRQNGHNRNKTGRTDGIDKTVRTDEAVDRMDGTDRTVHCVKSYAPTFWVFANEKLWALEWSKSEWKTRERFDQRPLI